MVSQNHSLPSSITMTSREISELTGKQHGHVMRDIRNLLKVLSPELVLCFRLSTYFSDDALQEYSQFELNRDAYDLLINKYNGLARVPNRLQEEAALKTIEQLLGITLIRQYKIGIYRIDGYDIKNNIAYEIDELDHRYRGLEDLHRQRYIKKLLDCTFVRIKL